MSSDGPSRSRPSRRGGTLLVTRTRRPFFALLGRRASGIARAQARRARRTPAPGRRRTRLSLQRGDACDEPTRPSGNLRRRSTSEDGRADAQVFSPRDLFDPTLKSFLVDFKDFGGLLPSSSPTAAPSAFDLMGGADAGREGYCAGSLDPRTGRTSAKSAALQLRRARPSSRSTRRSCSRRAPRCFWDAVRSSANAAGVPSTAAWVRIERENPDLAGGDEGSPATPPPPSHAHRRRLREREDLPHRSDVGLKQAREYDPVGRTWTDLRRPPLPPFETKSTAARGTRRLDPRRRRVHRPPQLLNFVGGRRGPSSPAAFSWTWAARDRRPRHGAAGTVVYEPSIRPPAATTLGHNGGARPWFDEYDA